MTSDERARRATRATPATRALRATRAPRAAGALGWLLGAFVASRAELARAQLAPAPAADDYLVWRAPPGCSTARAIRERVSELIGEPDVRRDRVRRVVGQVSQARDGWVLHLTLVGAAGARERRLGAPHCADLAEAAAVAISLAFEAARARAALDEPVERRPRRANRSRRSRSNPTRRRPRPASAPPKRPARSGPGWAPSSGSTAARCPRPPRA